MTISYLIAFILPFVLAYIFTPIAKKLAHKVGAIDVPKDERRVHKQPIPRLGGLAIYLATIISIIILAPIDKTTISILIGGTIIAVTGIIDDIKPMSAKVKLLFQILAAVVVIFGGVKIEFITNPSSKELLALKGFAIPITIFWIVGITNTLNLIDGLDGLSAGVSGISSLSFLFVGLNVASKLDDPSIMVLPILMAVILAGSAFGFLPHNFNPARIFMGDTGSLFLGFMLSIIAIEGYLKSFATIAVVIPILILGIPIFDTSFAILRRLANKKPIMEADRGHLHHRLLDKGFSQKQTVLVLYSISILLGISAILFTNLSFGIGVVVLGLVSSLIYNAASTRNKLGIRATQTKRKHKDR
ncbi:UDP-GlcNAc:undecaprenyl-P GlcNAc 1-P transferase TagO [Gottschalkia acidurici 9a]|uniref:UDP-GlcNAc:undecaprenyl-P GlcNAc 1-P transferase TagO n=1 Tax=Gottschalkia acidurici (strain ATCC 7906 / DSM 604 / BCRC 14475 / CIP 104303 / KCTC 5404 / NCIMB 10678 / 9a) TaxID=1128398 RepID=K0AWZ8_GOTA9|nr:MraY family glycosyltransferase [Gottschalkia acidurici]AFS77275.1 UDP-GlcNAc:undecaprenyl-P GlcNAc 1-P transferase TagO [Gottschalkia acidurici 9a]